MRVASSSASWNGRKWILLRVRLAEQYKRDCQTGQCRVDCRLQLREDQLYDQDAMQGKVVMFLECGAQTDPSEGGLWYCLSSNASRYIVRVRQSLFEKRKRKEQPRCQSYYCCRY